MDGIAGDIARIAGGIPTTARNALEVARFGGLDTGEEPAPHEVVAHGAVYRLRHYFPDDVTGPPVLLVPPLMLTAEVWDVSPASSAVRDLHDHGIDPWVIDFGSPEHEAGGLERTLADHVLGVSEAVDRMRELTGHDVHIGGYSQGGMFCYQTAAYRHSEGIAGIITFGSPVNLRGAVPLGIPDEIAVRGVGFILDHVLRGRSVPGWATRTAFRLLDPVKSVRQQLEFLLALHDREALLPREGQRRFLMGEGWVAWPGPALAEFMRQFLVHNRMLQGGFTIADRLVTLADIDSPILCFVGEIDEIAPPAAVRPIRQAAPRPDVYEVSIPAGHFGLVVGSKATRLTWPVVAGWIRWLAGDGELPDSVRPMPDEPDAGGDGRPGRLGYDAGLLAGVGSAAARGLASSAAQSAQTVRDLVGAATVQLPRLARIGPGSGDARLSLALVLEERAAADPDDACFLFEDRAYGNREVNERVDAVVRGLLRLGVRRGEPVGVLSDTRPSGMAVVAALNRLGAVTVMLRPGGDVAREAALGEVTRIIAAPEHAPDGDGLPPVHPFLLREARGSEQAGGLAQLDTVGIDDAAIPDWYEPNAGRAGDPAFVFFTGDRDNPRVSRITNGRWSLSAFGAATSGAISDDDTVFSVGPLHHPSGLMTSVGGALAGGARIAIASSLDPVTFWDEVRRYGITIVSYTWAQLRDLVEAPEQPGERHHTVRLFMGSGMPAGLWRRVTERFRPARVLEFWASTEGEAILANVSSAKRGSLGRPLPGSAEVRIVRYDVEAQRIVEDERGFAVPCDEDEVGLLVARVGRRTATTVTPLRDVFEPGDRWLSTESMFWRDRDGDHWLAGSVDALIDTEEGIVAPLPIVRALEELPAVDLAVAYGLPAAGGTHELAVAAVSLRPGHTLARRDVAGALARLEPEARPAIVRVVDEIPLTHWYRPFAGPLRDAPIRVSSKARPAWYRDGDAYRRLTGAVRDRLLA